MTTTLHHFAAYGLWANTRFVERLDTVPDATLDAPVASSFPSLRATLLHIRDAEHTWWGRLTGERTNWPAEAERSVRTLLPHAQRFHDLVRSMDEAALRATRTYHDLRGNAHTQPAWMMVMHCINHGTQHRGQLITMMRSLGLDGIPANDMVVFQRALGG
jgi:uncharacterized damage-inducible protein DinB